MGVGEFLSFGDVVNVVLTEEAYPFTRDPEDSHQRRNRNGLQGRVTFADLAGILVYSHGGRCMPLFEEDSSKVELSDLEGDPGRFFPWRSVVSVAKVADSALYEEVWQKHERDLDAYVNAHDELPESSSQFYKWRNSLSQEACVAAYNESRPA